MRKLFIQKDDGTFEELAAIIADRDLRTINKIPIKYAVIKYARVFSSNKKSAYIEELFFKELTDFLSGEELSHLDEIKQKHLELFQSILCKKKSASSVNRQFTTYAHFFKKCLEFGYLIENPITNVKRKKENTPIRILWTTKEVDAVLKHSPKWFKLAFLFLALTGARPVELCNMRKRFYNVEDCSVTVFCDKDSGSRVLPLSQPAAKVLKILTKDIKDDDFVFKSSVGTQLSTDRLNKTLAKIQKRHNLKRITIYSLRHTYATGKCNADINLEKVRLLLGHKQIRTTLKYVKIDFLELKKIVNDD